MDFYLLYKNNHIQFFVCLFLKRVFAFRKSLLVAPVAHVDLPIFCEVKDSLELLILLPWPLKRWDCRLVLPYLCVCGGGG